MLSISLFDPRVIRIRIRIRIRISLKIFFIILKLIFLIDIVYLTRFLQKHHRTVLFFDSQYLDYTFFFKYFSQRKIGNPEE